METDNALDTVLDLARQNVLEEKYAGTPELKKERSRQIEAVKTVEEVLEGSEELSPPIRVQESFGEDHSILFNFGEDGLVIDVIETGPKPNRVVWSRSFTGIELVEALSGDLEFLN